jgi:hypothetical protein
MALCLGLNEGERVRVRTPEGRELWVEVGRVRSDGRRPQLTLRFSGDPPEFQVVRERLLADGRAARPSPAGGVVVTEDDGEAD